MSVVAAAASATVGPGAAYGKLCGGGGARKRKDVVLDQETEAEAEVARGEDGASRRQPQRAGLFVLETVEEAAEEERSSIGAASEDEEEDGEEADSGGTAAAAARSKGGTLACMDALDDALPIKRGLSNFFSGKSRSFANLQDAASAVSSARDLAKPENPFNKRRRVLRGCSIRRVASTPLAALPPFLPPAAADDDGAGGSGG